MREDRTRVDELGDVEKLDICTLRGRHTYLFGSHHSRRKPPPKLPACDPVRVICVASCLRDRSQERVQGDGQNGTANSAPWGKHNNVVVVILCTFTQVKTHTAGMTKGSGQGMVRP